MAAGIHIYTVKATISTGAIVTSAPVTVNVVPGATIDLSTLSNFYLAPATIDLNASVTAVANTTIAKVEFFNGSNLIATMTAPPYNFRWPSVAAGGYSFTAKVTDSRGLTSTSPAMSVTVGSSVAIQIGAGLNGATVDEDSVFVSGSVSAPPNSAVNVNGQLATVTGSGQFFLNDLYLQVGPNTVTATVTTPDGQTASQVITVTRSTNAALFTVSVTPNGLAAPSTPFIADIIVENPNNTPFATVTVACNDPGAGSDVSQVGTYRCPYTEPGNYTVRVTVKNVLGGVIYAVTKRVMVKSAVEHIANVRAVYANLTDRLKAGNRTAALGLFFSHAQTKYGEIFTALGANLALAAAQLGETAVITASEENAEIVVVRTVAGQQRTFLVYLLRGEDGVWRIESM